jgi:HD-GYP domain-containing protein (c-di-GMP phosphodiesterase class II)
MLDRIRLWEDLAPMVLHHHEWWDGGGYPEGLIGEAIPLEARIIGIAEAFDSMTTALWRDRLPVEEALRRLEAGAGTQFDPGLTERFVRLVRSGALRPEVPAR